VHKRCMLQYGGCKRIVVRVMKIATFIEVCLCLTNILRHPCINL
jgi:hypothetical protein